MEVKNTNLNFEGRLYGHLGKHKTKPIELCEYGDEQVIKHINKLAKKGLDTFEAKISNTSKSSIQITTDQTPELTLLEKLFIYLNPSLKKALKMKKNGSINKFTYDINEFEYQALKDNALDDGILYKNVLIFENNLRKKITDHQELDYLEDIIY